MNIKKCPFCGAEAEITHSSFGDYAEKYYRVECKGIRGHCLDSWTEEVEDAVAIWNDREE